MNQLNQTLLAHEQRMAAMYAGFVTKWAASYKESKAKGYLGAAKYELTILRKYRMQLQWANQRAALYAVRKD